MIRGFFAGILTGLILMPVFAIFLALCYFAIALLATTGSPFFETMVEKSFWWGIVLLLLTPMTFALIGTRNRWHFFSFGRKY